MNNQKVCFGVITLYSFESEICGSCKFKSGCETQVASNLYSLSTKINISDYVERFKRGVKNDLEFEYKDEVELIDTARTVPVKKKEVSFTEQEMALIETASIKSISKKAKTQLVKIIKSKSLTLLNKLIVTYQNPFVLSENKYLFVTYKTVSEKGEVSKSDLVKIYKSEFKCGKTTAASQVSIAIQILESLGAVIISGKKIKLRKF